jgi:tRNA threonylcarbamoyladenosine biosynthesis protein TsaB
MTGSLTLAIDTSTAACTAALFDDQGTPIGAVDRVLGRGHAEQLVPMIAELMAGRRADTVIVGCGPGSFTGLRVGIAAAQGLAIGWDARLLGMSSLALIAACATGEGRLTVAVTGGHGELFVQGFSRAPLVPLGPVRNLSPSTAVISDDVPQIVGSGASAMAANGALGGADELLPSASHTMRLPSALRSLDPRPLYVRAPDAAPRAA